MFKKIPIPHFYSLIKKNKALLLLKDGYKNFLLQQGIEDLETFLKKNLLNTTYLHGRTLHPSIPISDGKRMILRQYFHGGLLRTLTQNVFLLSSRAFKELILTEEIRSCGIPTVEPIGAIHQVTSLPPFYRAYLLTLEVPGALNLIQYFKEIGSKPHREKLSHKRKMIRSAGLLLRQFHQSGFFHRDLQLKNILVAGDRIRIIDFDRSYRKLILTTGKRIKNLLRLNRSVEKWRQFGLPITRTDRWRFFLAYAGEDKEIEGAMQRVLRTYSLRLLFYRLGWGLEKIVRSF
jgi:3-deoxy-D-manno-octulosonic acid kinase